jgi:hypothetical protein
VLEMKKKLMPEDVFLEDIAFKLNKLRDEEDVIDN